MIFIDFIATFSRWIDGKFEATTKYRSKHSPNIWLVAELLREHVNSATHYIFPGWKCSESENFKNSFVGKCGSALTRKYNLSQPFLLHLYFFWLRALHNLCHSSQRTLAMWDRNRGESQRDHIASITKQKKLFKTYEWSIKWNYCSVNARFI